MAMPDIDVPTYPNVPRALGVPPVLRQAGAIINTGLLLVADAVQLLRLFGTNQWGLFNSGGTSIYSEASFLGVEWRKDSNIPDYPQEEGAFQSYNKIRGPWEAKVTLVVGDGALLPGLPSLPAFDIPGLGGFSGLVGSSLARRTAFINAVDAAADSLDLFTLVTPEIRYPNANIIHHDYRRISERGVTLFAVDIWVRQVRVTATATFSNAQAPSGQAQVDGGQVQPQAANPNVTLGSAGLG